MKKTKKVYLCATDWTWEVGEEMANPNVVVYPSVESLKKHRKCWETCGIVEIEMVETKTITKAKRWSDSKGEENE